jgi:hypothetical protein
MTCPQVADEGKAANILNKQSRTVKKGWSSILGVGCGDKDPHHKKVICYMFQTYFGPGLILWHDLIDGKGYEIWNLEC